MIVVPTAFAFAFVTAACGGSTTKTSPAASTSTSASTPTSNSSTTATTERTDRTDLVMKSALLRASDLPSTWQDSGESPASGSSQAQINLAKTIPACRDFARAVERENQQPKRTSNKFVDSTASINLQGEVSNEVVAWPSVASAKTAYGAYSAAVMKTCLGTLFRKIVAQQAAAGGLKVAISVENLPVPAVGDAVVGYEAVVLLSSGSTTRQIGFIIEIVRASRYTVSYNATLYKASPTDFGKNLVTRSIARLEAAPSS